MQTFEKQIYEGIQIGYHLSPHEKGPVYSDMTFVRCHFNSCIISHHIYDLSCRTRLKNMNLIKCEQHSTIFGCAIVEDVLVDGLKTHGPFISDGAVFKNVKLTGRIGNILLRDIFPVCADDRKKVPEKPLHKLFSEYNIKFYESVDTAIDISEAEFDGTCDIRNIPASKIKIDNNTQCRIMKHRLAEFDLDSIDFLDTYFRTSIGFLLDGEDDGKILVASKRNKKRFPGEMKVIEALKKAGVAE
jgi:hypothetical protein